MDIALFVGVFFGMAAMIGSIAYALFVEGSAGGFGDFIDILIDKHGRPWFGLSHNIVDQGIYGTMMTGPSLRESTVPLNPLPEGGFSTL